MRELYFMDKKDPFRSYLVLTNTTSTKYYLLFCYINKLESRGQILFLSGQSWLYSQPRVLLSHELPTTIVFSSHTLCATGAHTHT